MKQKKMIFLFFLSLLVLILFSCYPGMGPAADVVSAPTPPSATKPPPGVPMDEIWTIEIQAKNTSIGSKVMGAGEIIDLNAVVTVDGKEKSDAIVWSSNNTAVASVDAAGNVTAVAIGDAAITVTSSTGEVQDTFLAYVREMEIFPIQDNTIYYGKNFYLSAVLALTSNSAERTGQPVNNSNINWTISSGTNATVTAGGMVSLTDPGSNSTEITVKAELKDNPNISATKQIDIIDPPATAINFDQASPKFMEKGKSFTLAATAKISDTGDDVSDELDWESYTDDTLTSPNTDIPVNPKTDSSSVVVTANNLGDAFITAIAEDGTVSEDFVVHVRELRILPEDTDTVSMGLLSDVVGGLLESLGLDAALKFLHLDKLLGKGEVRLSAALFGAEGKIDVDGIVWSAVESGGLNLLTTVAINQEGVLTVEGNLLSLDVATFATVTVTAKLLGDDNTSSDDDFTAVKDIRIISLLGL